MATSYSNSGGTGDRRHLIRVITDLNIPQSVSGNTQSSYGILASGLLDGTTSNLVWFANVQAVSGKYVRFEFGVGRVVDEITWKQDNSTTHGTWKVQGSNDNSSWTDIGSSFTLGGTAQAISFSNTTRYRSYRLLGVSGNTSSAPFLQEVEFKIDPAPSIDYSSSLGTGNRSSTITVTKSSGLTFTGTLSNLVNGGFVDNEFFGAVAASGEWLQFDLGSGVQKIIQEGRHFFGATATTNHGTWKWQGSNDGSTWADIGGSFTWSNTPYGGSGDGNGENFVFTELWGNTTLYRYYRLLGVSGNTTSNPWLYEFDFAVGDTIPAPAGGTLMTHPGMSGGMRPLMLGGCNA